MKRDRGVDGTPGTMGSTLAVLKKVAGVSLVHTRPTRWSHVCSTLVFLWPWFCPLCCPQRDLLSRTQPLKDGVDYGQMYTCPSARYAFLRCR